LVLNEIFINTILERLHVGDVMNSDSVK
jgi:hypothetical protein